MGENPSLSELQLIPGVREPSALWQCTFYRASRGDLMSAGFKTRKAPEIAEESSPKAFDMKPKFSTSGAR